MPRTPPDHRARRVLAAVERGEPFATDDADERHLHLLLTTGEAVVRDVEDALGLWLPPDARHVVNALILAKATDDQIAAGLDAEATTVAAYRRLFFDRAVFRSALDVVAYVRELADVTDEWRGYYQTAIQQGPEFLLNRFRVGTRPPVDPRVAIQTVLADSHDRFLTHRGQKLDGAATREALRWGAQTLQAASIAIDKGGDQKKNVLAELRAIMLKTEERTLTPEAAGIDPSEVL